MYSRVSKKTGGCLLKKTFWHFWLIEGVYKKNFSARWNPEGALNKNFSARIPESTLKNCGAAGATQQKLVAPQAPQSKICGAAGAATQNGGTAGATKWPHAHLRTHVHIRAHAHTNIHTHTPVPFTRFALLSFESKFATSSDTTRFRGRLMPSHTRAFGRRDTTKCIFSVKGT